MGALIATFERKENIHILLIGRDYRPRYFQGIYKQGIRRTWTLSVLDVALLMQSNLIKSI